MRIVSLCPSNTELLDYIGLGDVLVGVDDFSDWPPSVRSLPRLGPDRDIDMDALEGLRPDLVVASLSVPGMEKNVRRLEERGLPHIVIDSKSLDDIGRSMLAVGEAAGVRPQAEQARQQFQAALERYAAASSRIESRPALYWEWWPKPVYTPGGLNWLTEISRLAGGRNLFADVARSSVRTERDAVLDRSPDYILLAWVGVRKGLVKPETVAERPGWERLEAVREGRVYVMEEALFCRPSPRLLEGLRVLGELLHPGLFRGIAP